MFVNKLKMDEIAEAVKKCMDEADLEETGLRKAAYAAHTKGEKMFSFKGKTYPVKVQGEEVSYGKEVKESACEDEVKKHEKRLHGKDGEVSKHVDKMHKEELSHKQKKIAKLEHPKDKIDAGDLAKLRGEEVELDEADKVATSTGMRVYGSSYGDSAKARRDQLKRPVDDTKGPNKSQLAQMAKVKKEEFFKDKLISNYIEEEALFEAELQEVLSKDATAGEWISDFVHSDNPKFAGKSVKKRQKMALAAYYAKKNESVDDSYPVTTDTVAGRMPGGMANTFKQFKVKVSAKDKEAAETKNRIPNSDPMNMTAREPHVGHGGLVSIAPAGIVRKEEVEQIEEITQADVDKSAEQEVAHAKKLGWKVEKETYGRTYKHPKHGHVDMNRYGEWQHRPKTGIFRGKGDLIAHGQFKDLDKHLSSLKEEVEDLDEGVMDKMSLSALWHKHGHHHYVFDQGHGHGYGSSHHNDQAMTAIENHVRKHHGNKVADDMVHHSELRTAADEYLGGKDARNAESTATKLRAKHKIQGDMHGNLDEEVELDEATPPKNTDIADKSYLKDMGKKPTVKSDIKNFGRFLAGKKETNEEVELEEAASRKDFQMVADLIKTHDNHDKRKELATHHAEIFHRQNPRFDRAKFMKAADVNEGKQPETNSVPFITNGDKPPFDGPYTKTPSNVKDKSGAVHTPMSRARDLAKSAMKRVKTEMLGKAPGNNG